MHWSLNDTAMHFIKLHWYKFTNSIEDVINLAFEFCHWFHMVFKSFLGEKVAIVLVYNLPRWESIIRWRVTPPKSNTLRLSGLERHQPLTWIHIHHSFQSCYKVETVLVHHNISQQMPCSRTLHPRAANSKLYCQLSSCSSSYWTPIA